MTDSGYAHQVLEALDDNNPRESIFRVKQVVARELEAFDDSVKIQMTDHFNHSFSPDMVLKWPNDNASRHVYLRFTDDLSALADDMPFLETLKSPMIFGLSNPTVGEKSRRDFAEQIVTKDIFLTEPDAIEALIFPRGDQHSTARMLRNSLAQGGKGAIFGKAPARELASVVHDGIEGAGKLKVTETSAALEAFETYFSGVQASRLTQVIQAVWSGAKGRVDQFPRIGELPGRLNTPALIYLMEYMETESVAFWRGVGKGLSILELSKLSSVAHTANFQHLVNSNLDSIRARAVQIFENPLDIDGSSLADFFWKPFRATLELVGPQFMARIADSKDDLTTPISVAKNFPKSQGEKNGELGINVEEFIHRWRELAVADVHLSDDREVIDYSARDTNIGKVALRAKAKTFGTPPLIERSTISTKSGRVALDFKTKKAVAAKRSQPFMVDLLAASVPMLAALSESSYAKLTDKLSVEVDSEPFQIPF